MSNNNEKEKQNAIDDLAVSRAIQGGANRAAAIAREAGFSGKGSERRVDRSLQRLRKRGVVVYASSTGWKGAK